MLLIKCYGTGSDPQFAVSGYGFSDFDRYISYSQRALMGAWVGAGALEQRFRLQKKHGMVLEVQQIWRTIAFVPDGRLHLSRIVYLSTSLVSEVFRYESTKFFSFFELKIATAFCGLDVYSSICFQINTISFHS